MHEDAGPTTSPRERAAFIARGIPPVGGNGFLAGEIHCGHGGPLLVACWIRRGLYNVSVTCANHQFQGGEPPDHRESRETWKRAGGQCDPWAYARPMSMAGARSEGGRENLGLILGGRPCGEDSRKVNCLGKT